MRWYQVTCTKGWVTRRHHWPVRTASGWNIIETHGAPRSVGTLKMTIRTIKEIRSGDRVKGRMVGAPSQRQIQAAPLGPGDTVFVGDSIAMSWGEPAGAAYVLPHSAFAAEQPNGHHDPQRTDRAAPRNSKVKALLAGGFRLRLRSRLGLRHGRGRRRSQK